MGHSIFGSRKLGTVMAGATVAVLILVGCGQGSAPTSTPTKATPTATQPAATSIAQATATSRPTGGGTAVVPTPTPVAAVPTATAVLPTPTASPVFGRFNVNPDKILVRYPFSKPDFSVTPKRGGVLVGNNNFPWPHFDVTSTSSAGILGPLSPAYSKLLVCKGPLEMTRPNPTLCEAGPQLAESWEMLEGGKVWVLHLRKGVKWQNLPPVNGREFTADDVKWTFEYYKKGGPRATAIAPVANIETPDKYTVKITLKEQYPDFVYTGLAERYMFMLPHEIADRDGDFKKTIVGTGPFQVKQVQGKERIIYERNPNYFNPAAPLLDGIDYSIVLDGATVRAAFRAGQMHIVMGDSMTMSDARTFVASTPHAIFGIVEPSFMFVLYMRQDKPPFNDVRVRRAVSMAIDRPGIIKDIFEGESSVTSPVPWLYIFDSKPTLDALPYYKFDRTEAKRLLAEAGYANGFKFKTNFYPYPNVRKEFAVWIDNLRAVGIDMELLQQDNTSFNTSVTSRTYENAAASYVLIWSGLDGWLYANMYSKSPSNYGGINDPALDKLLDAQRTETDTVKRNAIAKQVYQMEADQVWRMPLTNPNTINYYSSKLHNFVYHETLIPFYNLANTLDYLWVD